MISVIVRTRNEERWIAKCLKAIQQQTVTDVEVVLVDNMSTDRTVDRALQAMPSLKLVQMEKFLPGLAINEGIRASSGDAIAILSAHCIPANPHWLESLRRNLDESGVAGVYGRQIPVEFTTDQDKRDLLITFGLDRRVQVKDSFFHNANSMLLRSTWEAHPFDEKATNIEDRIWGKEIINADLRIIYEPDAVVYHHHGIHQSNDRERMRNVVRILGEIGLVSESENSPADPRSMEVCAILPLRRANPNSLDRNEELLAATLDHLHASTLIKRIVVAADTPEAMLHAKEWNVDVPFLRPPSLSGPNVRADEVLRFTLNELEAQGYFPDVVVALEITHPFRPPDLVDNLVRSLCLRGLDTVVSGVPEYRPCWMEQNDDLVRIDDAAPIRDKRKPVNIGLFSLGCATLPEVIRKGSRIGAKVGILEVRAPLANIEIRSTSDIPLFQMLQRLKPAQPDEA